MTVVKLLRVEDVAADTKAFYFEKPEGFEFKAGNSVDIKLINPPETDDEGTSRTFSLIVAPDESELGVATRMRDTAFKRVIGCLQPGDEFELEGPWNSPTLHNDTSRPAVFLIGGVGITAVRSILRDADHRDLPHEIDLFYANRNQATAPFFDELTEMANRREQFHFFPTFTGSVLGLEESGFATGRLTLDTIKDHVTDLNNATFYLFGPAAMVKAMLKVLTEAGVDSDYIKVEEYPGY